MSSLSIVQFGLGHPSYPYGLRDHLGSDAPASIFALGDLDLLESDVLALFCSIKCPGKLILETYDLAQRLRMAGITVISGFHSPMERECLAQLLRGIQPIILCPSRGIQGMRIAADLKQPLQKGRLLFLSPFAENMRRANIEIAVYRNRLVAALAGRIFVAHAEPASKTEAFCREVIGWGKPLYTLDSDANQNLIALGARRISPYGKLEWL
ncbi:MAG: DNA-processing protein DprA [Chloroflexi bacterium]|nr:DNA-processing protein DprA [Chloroflexota bacterium]